MNFGERAAERRKSKELKGRINDLKKDLLAAGCSKDAANDAMKDFGDTLKLGGSLRSSYENAKEHIVWARQAVDVLLENMGDSSNEDVGMSFSALLEGLGQVYHDCLIREDDMDFQSSVQCIRRLTGNSAKSNVGAYGRFPGIQASGTAAARGGKAGEVGVHAGKPGGAHDGALDFQAGGEDAGKTLKAEGTRTDEFSAEAYGKGMSDIMLRSELENLKSVLDDASGWAAPDFFALGYYILHEGRDGLKEMENGQRNKQVLSYTNGHFMDSFVKKCRRAGAERRMREMIQEYVYGTGGK